MKDGISILDFWHDCMPYSPREPACRPVSEYFKKRALPFQEKEPALQDMRVRKQGNFVHMIFAIRDSNNTCTALYKQTVSVKGETLKFNAQGRPEPGSGEILTDKENPDIPCIRLGEPDNVAFLTFGINDGLCVAYETKLPVYVLLRPEDYDRFVPDKAVSLLIVCSAHPSEELNKAAKNLVARVNTTPERFNMTGALFYELGEKQSFCEAHVRHIPYPTHAEI